MKPIEGVALATVMQDVAAEMQHEQLRKLREKIAHIYGQHRTERGSIAALEQQLVKARERLVKVEDKLRQLEGGNWSVLEEEPLPKVSIGGKEEPTKDPHG